MRELLFVPMGLVDMSGLRRDCSKMSSECCSSVGAFLGAEMATDLWILTKGGDRIGAQADGNPLTWTVDHASLVATSWDLGTNDGVNEAGLAGHMLWLAESDLGTAEHRVRSRCAG